MIKDQHSQYQISKRLFANAYNEFMKQEVWCQNVQNVATNGYLKEVGKAIFKYFDIWANVAKFYCYLPSDSHKRDMLNGIRKGLKDFNDEPENERPELSPHYMNTRNNFRRAITFCAVCSNGECPCNRYIVHTFVATCELVSRMDSLEDGKRINLSVHHFYTPKEIVYFLDKFTKE